MNLLLNISSYLVPFIILFTIISSIDTYSTEDIIQAVLLCLIYWVFTFVAANFRIHIESGLDGLSIYYLWRKISIPWEDVVDLKPLLNLKSLKNKHYVIRTTSITPAHRLIGLFYSFSLSPSIYYNIGISDHDELTSRIRSKIDSRKE